MNLVVVSHKICWQSNNSPSGYSTDGGFPLQMKAISELFTETTITSPCENNKNNEGVSPLIGKNLKVRPLSVPAGVGFKRKILFPVWLIKNGWIIFDEVRRADAVHTPIPGDVGTIGMFCALLLRKPLFVRHCGNWLVQTTKAEQFWKWSMEKFAGGRNVMLATGGAAEPPSKRNANIKWIFSTSLRDDEIQSTKPKELKNNNKIKLIIACRQEKRKGTDIVIESLPLMNKFGNVSLDIVGGGSLLPGLKRRVKEMNLEDRVAFHGKVEQSRVVKLLKNADVFCYPTTASEGFPKVVLEALASGLPVITTNVSVLPQLIKKGGGIILEEPTAPALATAISEICADKAKYRQMSQNAITTAKEYSLENWRDFIGNTLSTSWKAKSLS